MGYRYALVDYSKRTSGGYADFVYFKIDGVIK